jgi:hypothetical protein
MFHPIHSTLHLIHVDAILDTGIRDSCFTCDGSLTKQVFPLIFLIGMVIKL